MLTPVTVHRPPGPLCEELASSTPTDGAQIEMVSFCMMIIVHQSKLKNILYKMLKKYTVNYASLRNIYC